MSAYDDLKSSSYALGLARHREKSDSELQQIIHNDFQMVLGLSSDLQSLPQRQQLMGEIEACQELLSRLQRAEEEVAEEKKKWRYSLQKRKDDALLALRAAATPNGQLVQAILEDEDSLSFKEIAGWCDELGALDEEVLMQLLKDLVEDGVLEESDNGQYRLRMFCDENQQWDINQGCRYLENSGIFLHYDVPIVKTVLYLLCHYDEPMCPQDIIDKNAALTGCNTEQIGFDKDISAFSVRLVMGKMMRNNILTNAFRAEGGAYYAPAIIGEKGREQ